MCVHCCRACRVRVSCMPRVCAEIAILSLYTCWTSLASLISKLPTRVPPPLSVLTAVLATCVHACAPNPTRSCVTIDVRLSVAVQVWLSEAALRRLSHSTSVCPLYVLSPLPPQLTPYYHSLPHYSRTRRPISAGLSRRVRRAPRCSHREAARLIRSCACACARHVCALNVRMCAAGCILAAGAM